MYIFLQVIAGFLGTISFAVIFEAPKKYYLYCGGIGALGWLVYLLINQISNMQLTATFISALTLTFLSREAAYALKAPVTIFLITGIFCIVPGIGIYNFTYNFFIGDSSLAIKTGMIVLKVSIAIALGISLGYELSPKCFFGFRYQQNKLKNNVG